jgi:hybrid cluster-associated redox disulfide protein
LFQHNDQRPVAGGNCAYGISAKAEARMGGPGLEDPDLPLQLVFLRWPEVAAVFRLRGMACFGCPVAPFHTVIDACAEYGLDETAFRTALQAAMAV